MKNNRLLYLLVFAAFFWLAVLTFLPQEPETANGDVYITNEVSGFSTDLTKVAKEKEAALVSVETPAGLSSGLFYSRRGEESYFLCVFNTRPEGEIVLHFANGYSLQASLKGYDPYTGLALLEAAFPYDITPITEGDTSLLQKGEFALALGSPQSLDYSGSAALCLVADPEVSIERELRTENGTSAYYLDLIALSTRLNSSFRGGPVFNMGGELIGIDILSLSQEDIAYILPAEETFLLAEKLMNGEERKLLGLRGISVADMPDYQRSAYGIELSLLNGLYIRDVLPGSPAERLGLHTEDILLELNGEKIGQRRDLLPVTYRMQDDLTALVRREGAEVRLNIHLEPLPAEEPPQE